MSSDLLTTYERGVLITALRALTFRNEVTLSSGYTSHIYVDCRRASLLPGPSAIIARVIRRDLGARRIFSIGGPSIGADFVVGAIVAHSIDGDGYGVRGFVVRPKPKAVGLGGRLVGTLTPDTHVSLFDDVLSTGKSILQVADIVEAEGCTIDTVYVVVDRHLGGTEKLAERGYRLIALTDIDDILSQKVAE